MQDKMAGYQIIQDSGREQEIKELYQQLFPHKAHVEAQSRRGLGIYIRMIGRHKWAFMAPLFIIPTLTLGLILSQQPYYQSTATLLIEPSNPKIVEIEEVIQPDRSRDYLQTQYELIKSFDIAEKVINMSVETTREDVKISEKKSNLFHTALERTKNSVGFIMSYINPYIETEKKEEKNHLLSEKYNKIKELRESISIEPIRNTRLVNITIQGHDPVKITNQVNSLTTLFVENNLKDKIIASENASLWLEKEVDNLKEQLHQAEMKLLTFIEASGYAPQMQYGSPSLQEAVRFGNPLLHNSIEMLKAQKIDLEYKQNKLENLLELFSQKKIFPVSNLDMPSLVGLQNEYVNLENQIKSMKRIFKSRHPNLINLLNNKAEIEAKMTKTVKDEIDRTVIEIADLKHKEHLISTMTQSQRDSDFKFDRASMTYRALKHNVDIKRVLYEKMLSRLNETEVTSGLQSNNIKISQKAIMPVDPMPSNKKIQLLTGILLSFAVGLGGVLFLEKINQSFYNPDEVKDFIQAPLLGIMRHKKRIKLAHNYVSIDNSIYDTDISAEYRQLRTNILFHLTGAPSRSLLVTSAGSKEGKSTVAVNLGFALAKLGKSIVIIDANWRHPSLHKMLFLNSEHGLSDILTGTATWQQSIQPTFMENVKIIPRGSFLTDSIDFLIMTQMNNLCEQLKNVFDMVIIDSPALLTIPESSILLDDHLVLLIHNPHLFKRKSLASAKKILRDVHANLLGVVFNNVKKGSHFDRFVLYPQKLPPVVSLNNPMLPNLSPERMMQDIHHNLLSAARYDSDKDRDLIISICKLQYQVINHNDKRDESPFIIIDIDIRNNLDKPHIFDSNSANLYCKAINDSQDAIKLIHELNSAMPDEGKFAHIHRPILNVDAGTFREQEVINPRASIRGKLMYRVHAQSQHYIFVYEQHEIHISIPLMETYSA